jgi:hypothetical protein
VKGGLRAGLIDRAVEHVLSLHFTTQELQLFMPHKFSNGANPDLGSGIYWTPRSRIQPIFQELGIHFRFKNPFSFKSNPFLYLLRLSNNCLILRINGHLLLRQKKKLFPSPLFFLLDPGLFPSSLFFAGSRIQPIFQRACYPFFGLHILCKFNHILICTILLQITR